MRTHRIDATIDRQIITGMVVSTKFLKAIEPIYKPEFLMTPFAVTVAYWCQEYVKKYDKAPGKDIQNIFHTKQREGLDDTQAEDIEQFLTSLSDEYEKQDSFNADYLLDTAEKLFRQRSLKYLSEDIDAHLSNGNLEDAEKCLADFKKPEQFGKEINAELLEQINIIALSSSDFLSKRIRQPKTILSPWLTEGSLTMVFGEDGTGKTMLGLSLAIALTREQGEEPVSIGPWQVKNPTGVLYFDGEMGDWDFQNRLRQFCGPLPPEDKLHPLLILQSTRFIREFERQPNLTNKGWRDAIFVYLQENKKLKVLILDNISSLASGVDENSKEAWDTINQWLISIRSLGVAVVFMHHGGKGGQQRGTSGREDALDVVIKLSRPSEFRVGVDALRVKVSYDKFRGAPDKGMAPFELCFTEHTTNPGFLTWEAGKVTHNDNRDKNIMASLIKGKESQKEIAGSFDVSQATITLIKKRAITLGYLNKKGEPTPKGRMFMEDAF